MTYFDSFVFSHGERDGLRLVVTERRNTRLQLGYANRKLKEGLAIAMRISFDGAPLCWARVDDWWDYVAWLKAAPRAEPAAILSHIDAAAVHASPNAADAPAFRAYWLKHFGTELLTMLPQGEHWLTEHAAQHMPQRSAHLPALPPLVEPQKALNPAQAKTDDHAWGAVWPLRDMSKESDGRVKMWRKRARAGTLPPVILLNVSLLEGFVLLDGHDRLLAAHLEGMRPVYFVLSHLRLPTAREAEALARYQRALEEQMQKADVERFTPATIDQFNRHLIEAYGTGRREIRTRFSPMALDEWTAQVKARAAELKAPLGDLLFGLRRD